MKKFDARLKRINRKGGMKFGFQKVNEKSKQIWVKIQKPS